MPRNKIKQDFHFTTLKSKRCFQNIKVNKHVIDSTIKKNLAPFTEFDSFSHLFLSCQYLFTS